MAAFDKDKVIKQLAPESVKRIKEWRKEFCKPFNKKDAERLEQISDAVDRLFAQVVRERVLATQETSDRIPVWGEPTRAKKADLLEYYISVWSVYAAQAGLSSARRVSIMNGSVQWKKRWNLNRWESKRPRGSFYNGHYRY